MVTGGRAFQGQSDFGVASAILVKEPEPISTLQPLTPPALERTIRVCLAKDPGHTLAVGGRSLQGTAVDYGERVAKRRDADCSASPTGLECRDRANMGIAVAAVVAAFALGSAAEPAGRAWPGGARFSATEFSARGGFPGGFAEKHRAYSAALSGNMPQILRCGRTIPSRSRWARRACNCWRFVEANWRF